MTEAAYLKYLSISPISKTCQNKDSFIFLKAYGKYSLSYHD